MWRCTNCLSTTMVVNLYWRSILRFTAKLINFECLWSTVTYLLADFCGDPSTFGLFQYVMSKRGVPAGCLKGFRCGWISSKFKSLRKNHNAKLIMHSTLFLCWIFGMPKFFPRHRNISGLHHLSTH